jgi:hypothetical protein
MRIHSSCEGVCNLHLCHDLLALAAALPARADDGLLVCEEVCVCVCVCVRVCTHLLQGHGAKKVKTSPMLPKMEGTQPCLLDKTSVPDDVSLMMCP